MSLIEIVLFVGNEIIGRQKLGAVDAGDTIFVHLFGAYFGMAVSRVLHYKNADHHKNQASENIFIALSVLPPAVNKLLVNKVT